MINMNITVQDVIQLLCSLSEKKKMQAAVKPSEKDNLEILAAMKHCCKGAFVTGAVAFVGGLVGGRQGLLVGGAIGSLLAWTTSEEFKPVPQILMELSPSEKEQLFTQFMDIVGKNVTQMDVTELLDLDQGNKILQEQLLNLVVNYVTKELKANIRYGN